MPLQLYMPSIVHVDDSEETQRCLHLLAARGDEVSIEEDILHQGLLGIAVEA